MLDLDFFSDPVSLQNSVHPVSTFTHSTSKTFSKSCFEFGTLCVSCVIITLQRNIEVVNLADFVAPLEEGMPSDLFLRYVAPAPSTPPDQDQDQDPVSRKQKHSLS